MDLAAGRRRRVLDQAGPHADRGGGRAVRLRGDGRTERPGPAGGRAVAVGRPRHLGTAGIVDGGRPGRRPVRTAGRGGRPDRFRGRWRSRHAPGRLALLGRPGVADEATGAAGRCRQRRAPAGGRPGASHHRPRRAGAVVRARAVRRCLGRRWRLLAGDLAPPARWLGPRDGTRHRRQRLPRHRHAGRRRDPGCHRLVVAQRDCLACGPAGRHMAERARRSADHPSASGNVLTGVGYAATGTGRHPVLWQALVR